MSAKIAVVTGGNKGIGYGIVRALCKKFEGTVYLTARDEGRGLAAVEELKKEGLVAKFHLLDIDSLESIQRFRDYVKSSYGGLDVLVNNAAMAYKVAATEPFAEQAEVSCRVNFIGTLNVCNELFPLLRKHGRVVHVSSSAGHLQRINGQEPESIELRKQFADPELTTAKLIEIIDTFVSLTKQAKHRENGWPNSAYSVSKVAVSALTRIQQRELDQSRPDDDLVVNSVHPGYVDTDMTSHKGELTIDQGADAPVHLALLPPNVKEPRGGYVWHNKAIVDWVNGPTPSIY